MSTDKPIHNYTFNMSFPQEKWDRIFGKKDDEEGEFLNEIFGCPVVVSDDLEKGTVIVFSGFDDLGKPIATKIINTEDD